MDTENSALYITDSRLFNYAASAARITAPGNFTSGKHEAQKLKKDMAVIKEANSALSKRAEGIISVPAHWEWLLDNFYMVQREYLCAFRAITRAKRLRRSGGGTLIFTLCRSLLASGQGEITEERCSLFLRGFQSVTVLSRSELCLFPDALKAEIISAIAKTCADMQYGSQGEECASAMEKLFTSLRLLSVIDLEALINSCDVINEIFSADPTGIYPHMDHDTKLSYLNKLEELARKEGIEEHICARKLVEKAEKNGEHVGFLLFPEKKSGRAAWYILLNIALSLLFSLIPAIIFKSFWAALLLLLPVSELIKSIGDFILLHLVKPKRMPRMDSELSGAEDGTICVISVLLTDVESAKRLCGRLEELYHSCRNKNGFFFGLLADLPEASEKEMPEDSEIINAARAAVKALNMKYGGNFYLFTRERHFDGSNYSGHERKRGAIMALAALLNGKKSELQICGEPDLLSGVKYIVTLDSDTRVYPESLDELRGAMLHPLNKAVIDAKAGIVKRGCGIIQPRISTELQSANATDFSLIFAGPGGTDPYGGLCGELCMDAFGSGGFAGKGIIDAEALDYCLSARLPEGRILSHDAIEGAYLRGGFLGDREFSDSFPAKPLSYFKRLHRWIRGDIQNIPWIFHSELPAIERWRLFDSVRRAFVSPMTFLAIILGFFFPENGLVLSAWAALLALLSRLFLSFAEEGLRNREKVRLRRYTRILSGVGGAIVSCFMRLWLLPFEAFVSFSAIFLSLWRMVVSGKNLLQWQTAAQSEKSGKGVFSYIKAMWFSIAAGLLLLLFSPAIIGKSAGLMWLLSPLCAYALGLPAYKPKSLSGADRKFLIEAAKKNYLYFQEFSTEYDNFLPPDNFQEQPPVGIAHRTSPTNIGLAMCSSIAAMDMEIISPEDAIEHIEKVVTALEKLPKFNGQFYNWYDTHTLSVMEPPFISTVDSGNLYACLVTVREALLEMGEKALSERVAAIMAGMDFKPLYDPARGLFYICYDTKADHGAGGWYDLMASEALLTSYIAVSKGDVPVKHWRRLSRAQLQKDGYRGLASWTGTMFEYLMPEIFLPIYRGSLLYESSRFCLYVQKHRVLAGKPWGISESAFYSLDSALNYRYKASGCGALALKRGQDKDMVVSPYSSFLALRADPAGSVKNLRKLADFGAVGRFGFMEAMDFTPSRCRRDNGEKVRCYMAHHIGMSICSCANALCDSSISRRFMSNSEMSAHNLLLQERIPADGVVIRRAMAEISEKTGRNCDGFWEKSGKGRGNSLCLLSNGAYNILAGSSGKSCASWGRFRIYGTAELPTEKGFELSVKRGSEKTALIPQNVQSWTLAEDRAKWESEKDGLTAGMELFTCAMEAGEGRKITLSSKKTEDVTLTLSFKPILADYRDYKNHPAFWNLGIGAEIIESRLLLRRTVRGKNPEFWLCAGADRPVSFSAESGGVNKYLSQPFVKAEIPLSLKAGEKTDVKFAICISPAKEGALNGLSNILASDERGTIPGAAAARLGLKSGEYGEAMAMLPALLSPLSNAAPRRELWQLGISGDYPIICCDGEAVEAIRMLNTFCLLKSCGLDTDLVYLSSQEGEYRRPLHRKISEALAAQGLEALIGGRAGVHFAPESGGEIIKSRASYIVGESPKALSPIKIPSFGAVRSEEAVPSYSNKDGIFFFTVNNDLPPRAWQQILTNGRFSTIVSDCGAGAMWQENAREARINEPPSSARDISGTEALWVDFGGKRVSLFAANDSFQCKVSYTPGLARWEKTIGDRLIRLSALVPAGIDGRIIIIEGAEGLPLFWAMQPVLGAPDPSSLICRYESGIFSCENPESYIKGLKFFALSNVTPQQTKEFSPAAMSLSMRADKITVLVCGTGTKNGLYELSKPESALMAMVETEKRWQNLLGRFSVNTGNSVFDSYMNHWAGYQSVACRLMARGSLYQSGGAFGFRDQLQDAVNILPLSKSYAMERILDCCRHQYAEGDVMHWWHRHPDGDKGIRSRCSDDLLWLVWAVCEYVKVTGDREILREKTEFVISPVLKPEERERYETPEKSADTATVLDHCRAALKCCIARGFGPHGLPWFGSGDWNDGLDGVEGESVWLGWFLSISALRFSELLKLIGESDFGEYYVIAGKAGKAADNAWSGEFYFRGYNLDGSPLGGSYRIDSLPQSFAAFCPFATKERVKIALNSAVTRLFDKENKIVKLFDPPYSPDERYVGYIMSYGEGYRENGGQYTHAAVWLASACLKSGMEDEGRNILLTLLPENHDGKKYKAEPFVLPADVYSAQGHKGEGGWTWYTGSAGWYFHVSIEDLLGVKIESGAVSLSENSPAHVPFILNWTDFKGQKHILRYPDTNECNGKFTTNFRHFML